MYVSTSFVSGAVAREPTYSYRINPPKTARPPYIEIVSEIASPRSPIGSAIGARVLSATTVTPARSGPPQLRYLSFLEPPRQDLLVT